MGAKRKQPTRAVEDSGNQGQESKKRRTEPKRKTPLPPPPPPRRLAARGFTALSKEDTQVRYRHDWTGRPADDLTPTGLENASKIDCYRNTAYQALFSIPRLCEWLAEHQRTTHPEKTPLCPGCEYLRVFEAVYPKDQSSKGPQKTATQRYREEDAQRHVLREVDTFAAQENGWDKTWSGFGRRARVSGLHNDQDDPAAFIPAVLALLRTAPDNQVFFGINVTRTHRCNQDPNHTSKAGNTPTHDVVSLQLAANNIVNALEAEWNSGTYPWKCPTCKPKEVDVDSPVTIRMETAPEAIFFNIQRTELNGKNRNDIGFSEVLNLEAFLSDDLKNSGETALYRLSGVILHTGTDGKGHEVALVRGPTGHWHLLDDNHPVETADSLEQFLNGVKADACPTVLTYVKAERFQKNKSDKRIGSGSDDGTEGDSDGKGGDDKEDHESKKGKAKEDILVNGIGYDDVQGWTVDRLKAALRAEHLALDGKKQDLIDRLYQYQADQENFEPDSIIGNLDMEVNGYEYEITVKRKTRGQKIAEEAVMQGIRATLYQQAGTIERKSKSPPSSKSQKRQ